MQCNVMVCNAMQCNVMYVYVYVCIYIYTYASMGYVICVNLNPSGRFQLKRASQFGTSQKNTWQKRGSVEYSVSLLLDVFKVTSLVLMFFFCFSIWYKGLHPLIVYFKVQTSYNSQPWPLTKPENHSNGAVWLVQRVQLEPRSSRCRPPSGVNGSYMVIKWLIIPVFSLYMENQWT